MKKYLVLLILVLIPINVMASENISYKPIPIPFMQIPSNPIKRQNSGVVIYTGATTAGLDNKMLSKATYYYRIGNLNMALNEINSTLMYYPDDVQAQFLKSQISYMQGNLKDALDSVNKAIEIYPHTKLYIWRVFILAETNDLKYANQIRQDLKLILADNGSYRKRVMGGSYNKYIREILSKDRLSSEMVSTIYQTLLKLMNEDYRNNYDTRVMIPVMATYIQYIFDLDDSNQLFIKSGKDKNAILKSYTSSFQGQYSEIMTGLLTYASGNFEKGSQQITSGFQNVKIDPYNLNYAASMIKNTNCLIRPFESEYTIYGIGAEYAHTQYMNGIIISKVKAGSPAEHAGIKVGDKISSINNINLSAYPTFKELSRVVSNNNNTTVKMELSREGGTAMKWLGLVRLYTVSVPVNYPEKVKKQHYIEIENVQLKNGEYLRNYIK